MTAFVIVNPQSRGGKTGRDRGVIVAALRDVLGDVAMAFTERPRDATRLTREALQVGHTQIIAVGGDGTTNEVVNGFFHDGAPINAHATLGVVSAGTGGDFGRTIGVPTGYRGSVEYLRDTPARRIDVGHVHFQRTDGTPDERFFLNIASFGLSGDVVERVAAVGGSRMVRGPLTYPWCALQAIVGMRSTALRVTIDDHPAVTGPLAIGAVCNGRFFGGGMHVAPHAAPDDGMFDVVLLRGASRLGVIARMAELYRGAHIAHPSVQVIRGQSVVVTPTSHGETAVRLEIDGEGGAMLPARFSIRAAALLVHG